MATLLRQFAIPMQPTVLESRARRIRNLVNARRAQDQMNLIELQRALAIPRTGWPDPLTWSWVLFLTRKFPEFGPSGQQLAAALRT